MQLLLTTRSFGFRFKSRISFSKLPADPAGYLCHPFMALMVSGVLTVATAAPGYAQAEMVPIFTTTSLSSALNSDGTVTFSAFVESRSGAVPAGTVKIVDETTQRLVGMFDLADASIQVPQLPAGNYSIRAYYSGSDAYFPYVAQPSSSKAMVYNVLKAPKVELSILQNEGAGELVTFTATVTSGATNVSGLVAFQAGGRILATQMLDHNGKASFVTTALDRGSHRVVAHYEGGDTFSAAFSESQTVKIGVLENTFSSEPRTSVAGSFATPSSLQ